MRYSVRVLGQGPCEGRWRRLADELGVGQHIDWVGWPDHIEAQLPHYRWADVFAFTSLSMIPAMIFFLAMQRKIVGGLSGAVKG